MLAEEKRALLRDGLAVVLARCLASLIVWSSGFRAVSDDDFARVVLAQSWAQSPRLDPTGTSWLPLPFWLTGGAMRLAGNTSLAFARGVAFSQAILSSLLLLAVARILVRDRRAALVGALCAVVFPWSARLGVATVPELPAAALSLFAVATLASSSGRLRLAGGVALLAASWSRYEPWPLAIAFVLAQFVSGFGARPASLRARVAATGFALVGPMAWLVHNHFTHDDALHFLTRVSAYKRAIGGDDSFASLAYPLALVREEPELCLLALGAFAWVRGSTLRGFRAPLVALTAMVVALSLAAARGGAPTHHSGRALLAVWLLFALYVGAKAYAAFERPGGARLGFAALMLVALSLGSFVLRPWYGRLDSMAHRESETRIGARTRALVDGGPVLLEVRDFGFFAIQAGSGAPDLFVLDRTLDPLDPSAGSSFIDPGTLRARIARTGARYVVATETPCTLFLGEPRIAAGTWRLWSSPSPAP